MRVKYRKNRSKLTLLVALIAGLTSVLVVPTAGTAQASVGISQRMGWDACAIGSTANAQAFWTNTPFWNMGLYLGGSSYPSYCTQWSGSQVSTLRAQGWMFLPLWVGPQAPCTGYPSRFSYDTTTAFRQGRDQAVYAYNKIVSWGWDVNNTPLTYDLEVFDTSNSACLTAAKQFISGWVYQLHTAPAQKAGLYGAGCGSGLSSFANISYPPDFIHGADWTDINNPNTGTIICVPNNLWTANQRHKQYWGDHYETWNGVTLRIDRDCSDGPVYPGPDQWSLGQGCVEA